MTLTLTNDLERLARRVRPLIEPAVGAAFIALWIIAEAGRMSLDVPGSGRTQTVIWLATVGLIGLAIAMSRLAPRTAMVIASIVPVAQLFVGLARFGDNNWPVYFAYPVIAAGVVGATTGPWRRGAMWWVGSMIVLISALLTVPALGPQGTWAVLFGSGAANGPGSTIRNLLAGIALSAALTGVVLATIRWRRGWEYGRVQWRAWRSRGEHSPARAVAGLSVREQQVFHLAATGASNAEIAAQAYITEATVKTHMNHILTKLGLTSRAQLVAYAWRNGLAGSVPRDDRHNNDV